MLLADIFLPAMLFVICKSQSSPHLNNPLTAEKTSDLYANTGPTSADPSTTLNSDELLDNYRQFVAKSLLRLRDSCKLHDFLQSIKLNFDGEGRDIPLTLGEKLATEDLYINSMLKLMDKNKNADISFFLHGQNGDEPIKSALFYYLSVSLLLRDNELDDILKYMLREKCCKDLLNDNEDCLDSIFDKRNTIKKVKFHSWGGKRNGNTGNSREGNSDLGKDSGQAKVVIRTPFRPWGGKRQQQQAAHDNSNSFFDVVR